MQAQVGDDAAGIHQRFQACRRVPVAHDVNAIEYFVLPGTRGVGAEDGHVKVRSKAPGEFVDEARFGIAGPSWVRRREYKQARTCCGTHIQTRHRWSRYSALPGRSGW